MTAAPNDEARRQPGFETTTQDDAAIIGHDIADCKAERNMEARAALAGCRLYKLSDGEFLLCKYGMAKSCPDLRSVGALLDRIAGVSA